MVKDGNKIKLEYDDKYMHLKFNLQKNNITKINFIHDNNIINSVDLVKKLLNVTAISESSGTFHVVENFHTEYESKINKIVENVLDSTKHSIVTYVLKAIAGLVLILLALYIFGKLFIKK